VNTSEKSGRELTKPELAGLSRLAPASWRGLAGSLVFNFDVADALSDGSAAIDLKR
jgi:hypothetical protein